MSSSAQLTWRDPRLGSAQRLSLPEGGMRYHDVGSGPTIVFVHGALVNANLWAGVTSRLAPGHRCVALDLPLGSHLDPMPDDADLTPPGIAALIADAIAAIGLEDVTLVGNDTGGALCQLVATQRPERLGALVLTSCDAFDNFPPKAFRPFIPPLLIPGAMRFLLAPTRLHSVSRRIFSLLTKERLSDELLDSWTLPPLASAGVRHDVRKLLRGADKRYTLEAAERLGAFTPPTLIAWSAEDRFFPRRHAERLAEVIPNARLEWVADARTFSALDQPSRLADLIAGFVDERLGDHPAAA